MVEPIYKYPHVDLMHRSKMTNVWIGVSVSAVLLTVVGLVICWYVIGRRRRLRRQQQQQQQHMIQFVQMTAALPRVIYHPAAGDVEEDRVECFICLEEYQDGEELVELPGCSHLYHSQCIEKALREVRRECPVCRAQLEG